MFHLLDANFVFFFIGSSTIDIGISIIRNTKRLYELCFLLVPRVVQVHSFDGVMIDAPGTPTSTANGGSNGLDDVPVSKETKSRVLAGFREKILEAALSLYSGQYSVGFMDMKIPARYPITFSDIRRDHKPLLELKTVLSYYPSGFSSEHGQQCSRSYLRLGMQS